MRIIFNIIIAFTSTLTFSQTELYFGGTIEEGYATNSPKICFEHHLKFFKTQILPVTFIDKCPYNEVVEVYYNGEPYYIDKSNFYMKEETEMKLREVTESLKDSLRQKAKQYSIDNYALEIKTAKEFYNKAKAQGIVITDYSIFDESEYSSGTGYSVDFINASKKTIKYLWLTLNGYNRVNDFVSQKTIQFMGPISPDASGSASFNYVWKTDLVDKVKLSKIKIQYMDGTFKNSTKPSDAFISERCNFLLFGEASYE